MPNSYNEVMHSTLLSFGICVHQFSNPFYSAIKYDSVLGITMRILKTWYDYFYYQFSLLIRSIACRTVLLCYFYCDKHNGWNTWSPGNLNSELVKLFFVLSLIPPFSSTLLGADSSLLLKSALYYNKVNVFILPTSLILVFSLCPPKPILSTESGGELQSYDKNM